MFLFWLFLLVALSLILGAALLLLRRGGSEAHGRERDGRIMRPSNEG